MLDLQKERALVRGLAQLRILAPARQLRTLKLSSLFEAPKLQNLFSAAQGDNEDEYVPGPWLRSGLEELEHLRMSSAQLLRPRKEVVGSKLCQGPALLEAQAG